MKSSAGYRKIFKSILIIALFSIVNWQSEPIWGKDFSDWLSGAGGYEQAVQEHSESDKPLALYFYVDWCRYCDWLDDQILADPEVDSYMDDLIKLRINPEKGKKEKNIARQYYVGGYPSFFILPPRSNHLIKIHPFWRKGGKIYAMSPSDFIRACQQAAGE